MPKIQIVSLTVLLLALCVAAYWLLPARPDGMPLDRALTAEEESVSLQDAPAASRTPLAAAQDGGGIPAGRWTLVGMGETDVPEGDRAPNIVFNPDKGMVNGYAGCNRYSGAYEAREATVTFGPMMATRMACDQLDLETAYLDMLSRAARWKILGGAALRLSDGNGDEIARFSYAERTP